MSESKILLSLEEYIKLTHGEKHFVIPDYQRGYVWGKSNNLNKPDAVSYICSNIADAFRNNQTLFLQGITYCVEDGDIVLVDGQQRTTFFYILLKYLDYKDYFFLEYNARKNSETYLQDISPEVSEFNWNDNPKELRNKDRAQDIFFFNRTMRIIREKFGTEEFTNKKDDLRKFTLNNILFLGVKIQPEESSLIFTMMNSQKAEMLQHELIKSELLRTSSLRSSSPLISEAENQQIRSRLAREWDKWLRWWNRDDVKSLFCLDEQMGWLLKLYLGSETVRFEDFRKRMTDCSVKVAKGIFDELRLLQKRMEDAFYNIQHYNYVGFILRRLPSKQCFEFMHWYFVEGANNSISERAEKLKFYFDGALIKMTHEEIIQGVTNKKFSKNKISAFFESISAPLAFRSNSKDDVKAWLTRRNILEDNHQGEGDLGRKFDFSVWDKWSLEHILPKSKFYHVDPETGEWFDHEDKFIKDEEHNKYPQNRADIGIPMINGIDAAAALSEHCIGNLVLLYKHNNSGLGSLSFEEKKDKFFDRNSEIFKSRHLLHTVKAFAQSKWDPSEIKKQYEAEIKKFISEFNYEQQSPKDI